MLRPVEIALGLALALGVGVVVVLVAGIGFVGHVAVRVLGPRRGLGVTARPAAWSPRPRSP